VRGLLIVNPQATTTSQRLTDLVMHAFADALDLEVVTTSHRGHGIELGKRAIDADLDVVITVGGDGIINEVVNGLLSKGPGPRTQLATLPGGSANVFARALGLPNDIVEAGAHLLEGIKQGRIRTIGLGRADDRWFTVNAGVGLDAEVIAAMEHKRRHGRKASPTRYIATTASTMLKTARNRVPQLRVARGDEVLEELYFALVQNTSPWTYLGNWPIQLCPDADFNAGLDLFGMRKVSVPKALQNTRHLLTQRRASALAHAVTWHDQGEFTIKSAKPMAFQIDGEGMGEISEVTFRSEPAALTVIV
jgi:diacylglycerol kinase family enzyme